MNAPVVPDLHKHECGHKDRCAAPRGGCQACARNRHLKEEADRNERNRQSEVSGS